MTRSKDYWNWFFLIELIDDSIKWNQFELVPRTFFPTSTSERTAIYHSLVSLQRSQRMIMRVGPRRLKFLSETDRLRHNGLKPTRSAGKRPMLELAQPPGIFTFKRQRLLWALFRGTGVAGKGAFALFPNKKAEQPAGEAKRRRKYSVSSTASSHLILVQSVTR
jgi:hypothetical protein